MLVYRIVRLLFELVLIVLFKSNIRVADYQDPYCILIHFMSIPFALRTLPDIVHIATYPTINVDIFARSANNTIDASLIEHLIVVDDFYTDLEIRDNNYRDKMSGCFAAISLYGAAGLWFFLKYNHKNKPKRLPPNFFSYYLLFLLVLYSAMIFYANQFKSELAILSKFLPHQRIMDYCYDAFCFFFVILYLPNSVNVLPTTTPTESDDEQELELYEKTSIMAFWLFAMYSYRLVSYTFSSQLLDAVSTSIMFLILTVFAEPYRSRIRVLRWLWNIRH